MKRFNFTVEKHALFFITHSLTYFTFFFIYLCHFVIFLAFYPGLCTYDMDVQIQQYLSGNFCTNHPLTHTLFLGFFHNLLTTPNHGYAIATNMQILLVDFAITHALSYMYQLNRNRPLYFISILFYSIIPITPLLAISHTKDIPFSAFALVFFIDTIRIIKKDVYTNKLLFYGRTVINSTLMLLFRNNAIHATLLSICILITIGIYRVITHKNISVIHRLTKLFIVVSCIAIICSKLLTSSVNASNGSIKEMMSIPSQIMGYVYNHSASEDEKKIILQYIPSPEEYNYYLADPMKRDLPFEIWESSCKHFLLDSFLIAINHPVEASVAVLYNIQGFFDPLHCPYSSDHFFLARYDYRGDAIQKSKIPYLCDIYVKLFYTTEKLSHTPLIIFFNLGTYVWTVFIPAFILTKKSKDDTYLSFIFPFTYLCTLLLGPGAIIRYGFLYILLAPVSLFLVMPIATEVNTK